MNLLTMNYTRLEKQLQDPAFDFLKKIIQAPGAEIFLVGGAVRDFILNRPTKDYDFVVRGIPAPELELLLKKSGTVNLVGKTFGVFKFDPKTRYKIQDTRYKPLEPFDIALPRTEHSLSMAGGYKDFEVQSDHKLPIEEDLKRRDFTVNAIALKLKVQNSKLKIDGVIDPSDGLKDLELKTLRAVGEPRQRFQEDYSRILRGLRFACQLDFEIEAETKNAIKKLATRLNDQKNNEWIVSRETIGREVVKMFVLDPKKAFALFEKFNLFEILIPEILKGIGCPQPPNWHTEGDVFEHTRLAMKILRKKDFLKEFPKISYDAEVVFGTLFHDIGKPYTIQTPAKDGADRIRFNNHEAEGAKIAREISERLKLSVYPKESPYHINTDNLSWIIENHLIPVKEKADEMKKTTFEKYFFSDRHPSQKLLALSLADELSTIHESGLADTSNYYHIKEKMKEMAKQDLGESRPPRPIISGTDVMKTLNIPSGPKVGEILELLREEQLAGKIKTRRQALEFLDKFKKQ